MHTSTPTYRFLVPPREIPRRHAGYDGSGFPHTSGVRLGPRGSFATEPCRPTACTQHALPAPFPSSDHCSPITDHWFYSFSAKERDSETGLSYFGSRYYSSDLSIWLSVDPMSDKYASLSPYVYCADNPIKLVDPNGEAWETPEDEIMARELKEKAMNKIDRINHQIDQLYQKKDYTNNDRKANNTQKIIDYLETQKSFLDEGIKTIDDMGSRKEYTFHFNETNNRHSNVTQRGGDNNGIIDINIFSEIRHETAWHEMVHIGDWLSGNSNYGFCDGLLGAFNDTKGIFEKHAYQSEFSFSIKRFLEFNINSLYKIDEDTYKKFENR